MDSQLPPSERQPNSNSNAGKTDLLAPKAKKQDEVQPPVAKPPRPSWLKWVAGGVAAPVRLLYQYSGAEWILQTTGVVNRPARVVESEVSTTGSRPDVPGTMHQPEEGLADDNISGLKVESVKGERERRKKLTDHLEQKEVLTERQEHRRVKRRG